MTSNCIQVMKGWGGALVWKSHGKLMEVVQQWLLTKVKRIHSERKEPNH